MKLQNMTVIFIIIMIPIIIVTSYYIGLQIKTITMQKDYTVKLETAAKDSIQALEINTVEWNSSSSNLADSKRRDVLAAINTFTTSLANSMGIGGAGKGRIQTYVPAIAYTMYDGYYIYSASKVDTQVTDENGLTQFNDDGTINTNGESYQYILKPYSPYSARYTTGDIDITVNYTLDNYIKVYGTVGTGDDSYVTKEGYLVVCDDTTNAGITNVSNNSISGITYRKATIVPESLTEQIYVGGSVNEYPYIYDQYDNKLYWDESESNYFTVNANNQKVYLQTAVAEGDANFSISNTFRKISVPQKNPSSGDWSVLKIFQILNPGGEYKFYYEDTRGAYVEYTTIDSKVGNVEVEKDKDFSAINYYVESYVFTKWVTKNLGDITVSNLKSPTDGQYHNVDSSAKIFNIGSSNNPDPENDDAYATSVLAQHKKDVIINTLEKNLAQAQEQAQVMNPNYEYRLPQLTYDEWEQALSNISIIAYMQGMPIGLKYYNNYTIATSTLNKEYVDPDELYFAGTNDQYYHQRNCEQATGSDYVGYRSIDYVAKSYEEGDNTKYYYPHDKKTSNTDAELECYYCLVNRSTYNNSEGATWTNAPYNSWTDSYYNALARERYMQLEDLEGSYIPETTSFAITKGVDASTKKYGNNIEYTIKVTNNSSSDKTNVVLDDMFGSNVSNFMTVTSITIDGTSLSSSKYNITNEKVEITIDSIAKDETKTIKIIGTVIGNVGTYKNTAKITIDEETFSSSEITVNVIKDVKIVAKSLMPPTNIVFIIDASGSMVGTKINNVQTNVKSFVSKMPQDKKSMIGYVKFYSLPILPIPVTQVKGPYKIDEYENFNENLDEGIDGLILSWTTYYKGLEEGNELLKEMKKNGNENNIAIFLSDGKPTEGESYYKSQAKFLQSTASEVYAIGYGNADFTELKNNVASDEKHFFVSEDIETVFNTIFKNTIYNVNESINGESFVTTATNISGEGSIIGNWINLKNNSKCDFYIDNENNMKGGININSTKIILKDGGTAVEEEEEGLTLVEWSNKGYIGKYNDYLYLNLSKFSASGEITVEIVQ